MRRKHNRKILETPILSDDLLLLITNEVNFGSCGLIQQCYQLSAEMGKAQAEINTLTATNKFYTQDTGSHFLCIKCYVKERGHGR